MNKKISRPLLGTALWFLLLLAALIGGTYAWFTVTGRDAVNVTPMGGTTSEPGVELLISNSEGGPFDTECTLIYESGEGGLQPISTADLTSFYQGLAQNRDGITYLYEQADDRVDEDTIHGTVYLQAKRAGCLVFFDPDELHFIGDAQAMAALRLGLKITTQEGGEQTLIFKMDGFAGTGGAESIKTISEDNSVVQSISSGGEPSYTQDPAKLLEEYCAEPSGADEWSRGTTELCTLQADEIAPVEYWVYLEGCDEECSNPVRDTNSELNLAFVGVKE